MSSSFNQGKKNVQNVWKICIIVPGGGDGNNRATILSEATTKILLLFWKTTKALDFRFQVCFSPLSEAVLNKPGFNISLNLGYLAN